MIDLHALRSEPAARRLVGHIEQLMDGIAGRSVGQPRSDETSVALMEVCGTHTVAISRFGLRSMLPRSLRLLSGPGCPVCVTPLIEIDRAIAAARLPGVVLTTFGDMMHVPGSTSSLDEERAAGADVRILYSPLEALDIAEGNPDAEVVFVGVGFETTSPTIAATVMEAERLGVGNLSFLPFFKTVPRALDMLARLPGRSLDGFICPGHVSAIIGSDAYLPIARAHNIPCVVTGFEPLDILAGVAMLLQQVLAIRTEKGAARVENQYSRAVTPKGNVTAQELLAEVFEPCDAEWRQIGTIRASGYGFSERHADFDALARLSLEVLEPEPVDGCICGDIMLGRKLPTDCGLFASRCTPRTPVGPCMVSTEGACAAFYKYERAM